MSIHLADEAAQHLKKAYPDYHPRVGIVLGSGLGGFVSTVDDAVSIPYQELPGFPVSTVQGHAGLLTLGRVAGVDVVCLQGRSHMYEGQGQAGVKNYVRTLQRLGCAYFIATNAVGSMRPDVVPGDLMLISDHINFQGSNPLVGPNEDDFGPRFFSVDNAYDPVLRTELQAIAKTLHIQLPQGIYVAVVGPNYETAAEIRAFKVLGADVVGMSTVPEVLVAHHCGMKIAVISVVTNFATGLNVIEHDHHAVVHTATRAGTQLNQLLGQWITQYAKKIRK